MGNQVYKKEKQKNKKEKNNVSDIARAYLVNSNFNYKKSNNYNYRHNRNNINEKEKISKYLKACEKYGFPVHLNKKTKDIQLEIDFFATAENKTILKNNKNKEKETLVDLFINGDHNFSNLIKSPTFSEEDYVDNVCFILTIFESNKKKFLKSIKETKEDTLMIGLIASNSKYWIREMKDFSFKSKNIHKTIEALLNFMFFKFPLVDNEKLIVHDLCVFKNYLKTKSLYKSIKNSNSYIKLSKKQVYKFRDFPFTNKNKKFETYIKELYLNDVIQNKEIAKSLLHKTEQDTLIDFAFYVKNKIVNNEFFEKSEIAPLFDYVVYKKREYKNERRDFKLSSYDLDTLYNEMLEWHVLTTKSKNVSKKKWDSCSFAKGYEHYQYKDENIGQVNVHNYMYEGIVELNTQFLLKEEGTNLKHCVGSYSNRCISGGIAIFSYRKKEYSAHNIQSQLTIEINKNKEIVQIRGKKNRYPTVTEKNKIAAWAKKEKLIYNV